MRLAITHETVYRFESPASRAIQTLRLTPRNSEAQLIQNWRIDVSQDCRLAPVEDAFGNLTHSFSIDGPIDELSIVASGTVATEDTSGILHSTRGRLPMMVFQRDTERTGAEAAVRAFAAEARRNAQGDDLATLHALMENIHERIRVEANAPVRIPDLVLAEGAASVVDVAHLFTAAVRALGIPTRCVSGYLWQDDEPTDRPHAWIEAHLGPSLGWVGFDAVENKCPTDRWVRIAAGLDVLDTLPIRGVRTTAGAETVTTRILLRQIAPI